MVYLGLRVFCSLWSWNTCSELTTPWPRGSSTPFLRLQQNNDNTPQSFVRNTWRPNETDESWLLPTFLHGPLTPTLLNIYKCSWKLREPSTLWHHTWLFGTLWQRQHRWSTNLNQYLLAVNKSGSVHEKFATTNWRAASGPMVATLNLIWPASYKLLLSN